MNLPDSNGACQSFANHINLTSDLLNNSQNRSSHYPLSRLIVFLDYSYHKNQQGFGSNNAHNTAPSIMDIPRFIIIPTTSVQEAEHDQMIHRYLFDDRAEENSVILNANSPNSIHALNLASFDEHASSAHRDITPRFPIRKKQSRERRSLKFVSQPLKEEPSSPLPSLPGMPHLARASSEAASEAAMGGSISRFSANVPFNDLRSSCDSMPPKFPMRKASRNRDLEEDKSS